jgi:hypothetical protein
MYNINITILIIYQNATLYFQPTTKRQCLPLDKILISAFKNGLGKIWKTQGQFLEPEIAPKWVY